MGENIFFELLKAGPLSLVQDAGRKRSQHLGISQCGAMDRYAYHWANKLVQHHAPTKMIHNAIEITFGLLEGVFNTDTIIAIAGAECNATLNGQAIDNWSSYKIKAGDTLCFDSAQSGLRAYLAILGGWQVDKFRQSVAMHPKENWCSNIKPKLCNNDKLIYLPIDDKKTHTRNVSTPWYLQPDYTEELTLNIYPAYQCHLFDHNTLNTFLSTPYTINNQSDRMGVRLNGEVLAWQHNPIISEPIAYGSVQIPPDGQPIVLLNDRQTLGGYPKIGCVKKEDCWQLAQRRPGDIVRFKFIEHE